MACKKYTYAAGDTAWVTTFMEAMEKSWKGLNQISLTEYYTTVVCQIAEGSVFEIAGSLYIATSNTAITASVTSGICYINAIGTTASATFQWTTTAPVWRNDYCGYYASASSVIRVIGGSFYGQLNYLNKFIFNVGQNSYVDFVLDMGDWNMDLTVPLNLNHNFGDYYKNVRFMDAFIRNDADTFYKPISQGKSTADPYPLGGVFDIDATDISIARLQSEAFDATTYDSTAYNRGWVTVKVKVI